LADRFGQIDAAYRALDSAITMAPNDAVPYAVYGAILHSNGDNDRATTMLRQAIELDPTSLIFHIALAHVLLESGNPEAARDHLLPVVEAGDVSAETHNQLGVVYAALKQPTEALEQFEVAIALDPNRGLYHMNRAYSLDELGRTDDAAKSRAQARQWWSEGMPIEQVSSYVSELNVPDFFE
jgi:Flp pilus assembly protein TadD